MFQISVERIICTIKDAILPPQCYGDYFPDGSMKGLVVSADLSMNDYSKNRGRRGSVHFLFTGNTSVWFAQSDQLRHWHNIPLNEWRNVIDHDSCWAEEVGSVLAKLYFKWAQEINPDIAPRKLSEFCTLGIFSRSPWEKVRVSFKSKRGIRDPQILARIEKDWTYP